MGSCNIQPQYFLDVMDQTECNALLENYNINYKLKWEQVRYIAYVSAAVHMSNIKTPQDLLKFSWETSEKEIKVISKPDRQQMEKELLDWYNKNNR